MKKFTDDESRTKSADVVSENIDRLKPFFPEVFVEGKIDFEILKQLLGGAVDEREEKYGLNWHGKRRARQLALTPSTGTLRPCPEESVDWDTTRNLMIEGDNLEVLKLLQKSYASKVKLLYIDPPYNTGKDFVYPDNFQDNIRNYLELTGQTDGDGRKLTSNPEASGRFHTDWLNMLYPRLKLCWSLLRADGFIVISIDDHELGDLRLALNELYGEENFLAVLVYDRNRKNDAKLFSVGHEYMVVYARNKALLAELDIRLRAPKEGVDDVREEFDRLRKEYTDDWAMIAVGLKRFYGTFLEDDPRRPLSRFTNVDERGPYRTDGDPSWPGGGGPRFEVVHPMTGRPCKIPSRGWVWPTFDRMKQEIDAGYIVFGQDETTIPSVRRNLFEKDDQVMRSVTFSYAQKASQEFSALFDGELVFQNPKSYRDLHRLVSYLSAPGDVVLDCFAGSGTTGHGVMLANEDATLSRRFVLCQLPESLDPSEKEQEAAYKLCQKLGVPTNISEITKERLRRASKKVHDENPIFSGDLGFRVFKLDSSNLRVWDPEGQNLEQMLLDSVEHVKADRSEPDVLYELLLKLGLDLCVLIETRHAADKEIHAIGGGTLFACLARSIERDAVEAVAHAITAWRAELNPAGEVTCVFRDSAFADDVAKSNMAAILEQNGIAKVRSL